jgi:histidyl-tRNA synthetase
VILPAIEPAEVYREKMGPEVLGQMYIFPDKKGRNLCLRPEGTATCQLLAKGPWIQRKDVRIWYEARCYRYERPQAGRYREFTQIGVEVLNPRADPMPELIEIAREMVGAAVKTFEVDAQAKRGLAYYTADGFEIRCPILGAQKQVCGGGRYAEGAGFAIGLDRIVLARTLEASGRP